MLSLTRRIGESIVIGESIRVVVTAIERGKVRLGIVAPPSVLVHRLEVKQKIEAEKRQIAKVAGTPKPA